MSRGVWGVGLDGLEKEVHDGGCGGQRRKGLAVPGTPSLCPGPCLQILKPPGLSPSMSAGPEAPRRVFSHLTMDNKKRLAYAIIRFLHDQLRHGELSSDAQESLEGMWGGTAFPPSLELGSSAPCCQLLSPILLLPSPISAQELCGASVMGWSLSSFTGKDAGPCTGFLSLSLAVRYSPLEF